MSINQSINISLTGLQANQSALTVVSHNIANMNTEGYYKQRVNFAENRINSGYDTSIRAQLGALAGVKIQDISTYSNDYLTDYYRAENSRGQGLETQASIAAEVTDLVDELQGGLGKSFEAFYQAANALSQNPTDASLRINYVNAASAVATKFNSVSTTLSNYQKSLIGDGSVSAAENSQAGTIVSQINTTLEHLGTVNDQIIKNPHDSSLLNQRDTLLANLSNYTNITTSLQPNGTANVSIGDIKILRGTEVQGELQITANGTIDYHRFDDNTVKDVTGQITEGSLGGTLIGASFVTNANGTGTLDMINILAEEFAETMNGIQQYDDGVNQAKCYDRANEALSTNNLTEPLYNFTAGDAAASIKINENLVNKPDLIATARVNAADTTAVGNADNVLAVLLNRTDTSNPDLGNLTLEDYMVSISTKAALNANSLKDSAESQGAVVDGINSKLMAETGVNLDEELADMMKYQRAYQASARVFSACTEVLDSLINLGR